MDPVAPSLKASVLAAAKGLFLARGYDAVGMRDIARAVGRHPAQVYRLGLGKSDILAELIISLNDEQIGRIPDILTRLEGGNAFERTCAYLGEFYQQDIEYKSLRSIGASMGWTWTDVFDRIIIDQVLLLVGPIASWMRDSGLDDIPARCQGVWSLYYVGYRNAVIYNHSAEDCIKSIAPSLRYYF